MPQETAAPRVVVNVNAGGNVVVELEVVESPGAGAAAGCRPGALQAAPRALQLPCQKSWGWLRHCGLVARSRRAPASPAPSSA
eukprot:15468596-Alexandrium_andersonii.AAC.1